MEKEQNIFPLIKDKEDFQLLLSDASKIIEKSREHAYKAVNVFLTLRNWKLGERIGRDELDGAERAEYGKRVISSLAEELTRMYGKGFERKSLYNYVKFYRLFPEIVDAVSRKSGKVDAVSRQSDILDAVRPELPILRFFIYYYINAYYNQLVY